MPGFGKMLNSSLIFNVNYRFFNDFVHTLNLYVHICACKCVVVFFKPINTAIGVATGHISNSQQAIHYIALISLMFGNVFMPPGHSGTVSTFFFIRERRETKQCCINIANNHKPTKIWAL